jgi:hypothetical protein
MNSYDDTQLKMMAERPARAARDREHSSVVTIPSPELSAEAVPVTMGILETEAYKRQWRDSCRYRIHIEKANADRERELLLKKLEQDAIAALNNTERKAGVEYLAPKSKLSRSREPDQIDEDDEPEDRNALRVSGKNKKEPFVSAVTAGRVAASLIFAKMFDASQDVCKTTA